MLIILIFICCRFLIPIFIYKINRLEKWITFLLSFRWIKTEGQIVEALFKKDWAFDGRIYRYVYTLNIVYEYSVNNELYSSNTISFQRLLSQESNLLKYKDLYYLGKKVSVYYNRTIPAKSCLRRKISLLELF